MRSESDVITIVVNDVRKIVPTNATVADLLTQLELNGKRIAVELNHGIISRSSYTTTHLHENDRVEIVHAIGGG